MAGDHRLRRHRQRHVPVHLPGPSQFEVIASKLQQWWFHSRHNRTPARCESLAPVWLRADLNDAQKVAIVISVLLSLSRLSLRLVLKLIGIVIQEALLPGSKRNFAVCVITCLAAVARCNPKRRTACG